MHLYRRKFDGKGFTDFVKNCKYLQNKENADFAGDFLTRIRYSANCFLFAP